MPCSPAPRALSPLPTHGSCCKDFSDLQEPGFKPKQVRLCPAFHGSPDLDIHHCCSDPPAPGLTVSRTMTHLSSVASLSSSSAFNLNAQKDPCWLRRRESPQGPDLSMAPSSREVQARLKTPAGNHSSPQDEGSHRSGAGLPLAAGQLTSHWPPPAVNFQAGLGSGLSGAQRETLKRKHKCRNGLAFSPRAKEVE